MVSIRISGPRDTHITSSRAGAEVQRAPSHRLKLFWGSCSTPMHTQSSCARSGTRCMILFYADALGGSSPRRAGILPAQPKPPSASIRPHRPDNPVPRRRRANETQIHQAAVRIFSICLVRGVEPVRRDAGDAQHQPVPHARRGAIYSFLHIQPTEIRSGLGE